MNDSVTGQPRSMRVTGLDDSVGWTATSPDGTPVDVEVRGPDLILHTEVGRHGLLVETN